MALMLYTTNKSGQLTMAKNPLKVILVSCIHHRNEPSPSSSSGIPIDKHNARHTVLIMELINEPETLRYYIPIIASF